MANEPPEQPEHDKPLVDSDLAEFSATLRAVHQRLAETRRNHGASALISQRLVSIEALLAELEAPEIEPTAGALTALRRVLAEWEGI